MTQSLAASDIHVFATNSQQAVSTLFDEEQSIVSEASKRRQTEFATGRWCARQILSRLNITPRPLLCHPNGAPVWPSGMCGSISHTHDIWCAAGATTDRYQAIGADIEHRDREVSLEAARLLLNDDELEQIDLRMSIGKLLSAKECIFKLLSPIVGTSLTFEDFSVTYLIDNNSFEFRINASLRPFLSARSVHIGLIFENNKHVLCIAALQPAVKEFET